MNNMKKKKYLKQPYFSEGDFSYKRVVFSLLKLLNSYQSSCLPVSALEHHSIATFTKSSQPLVSLHCFTRCPRPGHTKHYDHSNIIQQ
ncbi:GSCOCG00001559001-RA-CDS [Cotesia congregata]|nr:GSCOCG00001559001-RA-CDS [Cotesia congregata]